MMMNPMMMSTMMMMMMYDRCVANTRDRVIRVGKLSEACAEHTAEARRRGLAVIRYVSCVTVRQ